MNDPRELAGERRRWRWSIGGAMVLIAALAVLLGGYRMVVVQRRTLAERDLRMVIAMERARLAEAEATALAETKAAQLAVSEVEANRSEANDLSEELQRLRRENEDLRREVERLQSNPPPTSGNAPE